MKTQKGTAEIDNLAGTSLQHRVNIGFMGFDIYGIVKVRVNILPQVSEQFSPPNTDIIENAHLSINFSKLTSKVCINYGGTGQICLHLFSSQQGE